MAIPLVRTTLEKSLLVLCQTVALLLVFCSPARGAEVEIRRDSPSIYTVVRGDTLWDIAGKFLEEPWLWPQVWQINPQIQNPDLIYPGDVIELAYENGLPVLRLSRGLAATSTPELPTVRLSPQVRREAIASPIPAIDLEQISAFLSHNSVITQAEYEAAAYLLAENEGRILISKGDKVLGRGNWTPGMTTYDIVRRGRDFHDPDTGALIGIEALTVGTASLASVNGERGTLEISENYQEIKPGDRLIPSKGLAIESRYLPTPPDFDVDAAIVSIGSGNTIGGLYDSLIINQGSLNGIEPGQILIVREPAQIISDEHGKLNAWQKIKHAFGVDSGAKVEFPGSKVATVLVYRVFDGTSLALVLKNSNAIRLNDRVVTP